MEDITLTPEQKTQFNEDVLKLRSVHFSKEEAIALVTAEYNLKLRTPFAVLQNVTQHHN